jgi:hypothetical protein
MPVSDIRDDARQAMQVLILAAHNISTMMAKLGLQDKDMAASAEAIQRNIPRLDKALKKLDTKGMKFEDLIIGQVFSYNDGRMSEAETWLPFVKTGEDEAMLLDVAGSTSKPLTDSQCLGFSVTTEVRMLWPTPKEKPC